MLPFFAPAPPPFLCKITLEPEMYTAAKAPLYFWMGTDTLPLLPEQAAAHTRGENLVWHPLPIPPAGESAKSWQFPAVLAVGSWGWVLSLKTGQALIVGFDNYSCWLPDWMCGGKIGVSDLIWQFGSYWHFDDDHYMKMTFLSQW